MISLISATDCEGVSDRKVSPIISPASEASNDSLNCQGATIIKTKGFFPEAFLGSVSSGIVSTNVRLICFSDLDGAESCSFAGCSSPGVTDTCMVRSANRSSSPLCPLFFCFVFSLATAIILAFCPVYSSGDSPRLSIKL